MPGYFPFADNRDEVPEEEADQEQNNGSGYKMGQVLLGYVFQFPLFVLFCCLTVIFEAIRLLKPLRKLNTFYDKKNHGISHQDCIARLIENLEKDAQSLALGTNGDSLTSNTYSFGSLYSLESATLAKEILQRSYTQLLDKCADQVKFGMIYLHDPLMDDSMNYVTKILCSEEFIKLLKKYQIVLWFGDITNTEGMQVSNSLKVRSFPFLGILTIKADKKIELYGKYEGVVDEFTPATLESILKKEYPRLLQLRQQKQNIEVERIIREQQDARFNESLRRDQERSRQEEEATNRRRHEEQQQELRKQWLLWRKKYLRVEAPAGHDSSKIAVRMPDGNRIVRKFDATLPIEEIYAFVELYNEDLLSSEDDYFQNDPPANYDHIYKFKLVVPVPRKELDQSKTIGEEAAIYPTGNIVIESIEE